MPYEWVKRLEEAPGNAGASSQSEPWETATAAAGAPPAAELHAWPHRSLPQGGFALVIVLTGVLLLVPLLALLGSPQLWGILPFALLTLAGLWYAFRASYRAGQLIEQLRLWPDRIEIQRFEPDGTRRDWQAHPHWVKLALHEEGGPVEHYLTLSGGGREVELGAFLSPEERIALKAEIERALRRL
jgi:uncharacterized membrane protein